MPCYYPLTGWPSIHPNPSGKRSIVFNKTYGIVSQELKVSCGQCIGCRLERSRQTATRCMHESQLHEQNCYITLTYDNDNLPAYGSLNKTDIQKFFKRLRKRTKTKLRYLQCGEYGGETFRPHHHAVIFGYDFPDQELHVPPHMNNGYPLYTSELLTKTWGLGHCSIGALTFESAAYVARYVTKKITGKAARHVDEKTGLRHYERIDADTGEIVELMPEYTTCSLKPGIGSQWLEKYRTDVYPYDEVIVRGKRAKPPRYYDKRFEIHDPDEMQLIKDQRRRLAEQSCHNTPERLRVREKVKKAQLKLLPRNKI